MISSTVLYLFHEGKWFHVLLFIACIDLNGFRIIVFKQFYGYKYCLIIQTIHFNINNLFTECKMVALISIIVCW